MRAQFVRTYWIDSHIAPGNTGSIEFTTLEGHNNGVHYDDGSTVQLEAIPQSGYALARWEVFDDHLPYPPAETILQNPTVLTMNDHKDVTAVFAESRTLTVVIEPPGAGTVTPGSGEYAVGSIQTLKAMPVGDYLFSYWAGDINFEADEDAASIDVTMDEDKEVTARFVYRFGLADLDTFADLGT